MIPQTVLLAATHWNAFYLKSERFQLLATTCYPLPIAEGASWSLPHQDEVAEALQDAASSDESAPEVPIQRACASSGILPAA